MGRLDGQVTVITGGASGIGEAAVRLFAREGARVVIADIQDSRGEALASELGDSARYMRADVTSETQVERVVQSAAEGWGRLDCIFNNAGFPGARGSVETMPVEAFDETFAVMVRGVFLGIKHAAPIMREQGGGSIINTASIAGLRTGAAGHAYSAAKAAVIHLTRSAAMELREAHIRVNCICPGFIATPIFARAMGLPEDTDDVATAAVAAGVPGMGRPGSPDDIAQAALWLASDESRFVNGHALVVDNGLTAGMSWSDLTAWNGAVKDAIVRGLQSESASGIE